MVAVERDIILVFLLVECSSDVRVPGIRRRSRSLRWINGVFCLKMREMHISTGYLSRISMLILDIRELSSAVTLYVHALKKSQSLLDGDIR